MQVMHHHSGLDSHDVARQDNKQPSKCVCSTTQDISDWMGGQLPQNFVLCTLSTLKGKKHNCTHCSYFWYPVGKVGPTCSINHSAPLTRSSKSQITSPATVQQLIQVKSCSSVQLLSGVQFFATSWTAACQASLSVTSSQSLVKLTSITLVMPSNHLIHCHPLLLPPSVFPSIRVFSNGLVLRIKWPKYWSFRISPSNEYSGLIAFSMDWLDLFAVQGTLESSPTPQFKSINSSALSFLYSPTLTSINDYWKNQSFS